MSSCNGRRSALVDVRCIHIVAVGATSTLKVKLAASAIASAAISTAVWVGSFAGQWQRELHKLWDILCVLVDISTRTSIWSEATAARAAV